MTLRWIGRKPMTALFRSSIWQMTRDLEATGIRVLQWPLRNVSVAVGKSNNHTSLLLEKQVLTFGSNLASTLNTPAPNGHATAHYPIPQKGGIYSPNVGGKFLYPPLDPSLTHHSCFSLWARQISSVAGIQNTACNIRLARSTPQAYQFLNVFLSN